ncbi:hypothetical protein AAC387_Pa06g1200 [Persea americana]
MALRGVDMGLAIAIVTMLWVGASAQTGCMSAIISLSPCLNYVTGSSSTPSSSCCTQLASVVSSQVQCLCTVLNGSSSLGITINQTRALALPSACNVQTPPTSQCNAPGGPSAYSPTEEPTSSTEPSTASTPGAAPTKSSTPSMSSTFGNGSKVGVQTSDASSSRALPPLMVFLTFIASFAPALTIFCT